MNPKVLIALFRVELVILIMILLWWDVSESNSFRIESGHYVQNSNLIHLSWVFAITFLSQLYSLSKIRFQSFPWNMHLLLFPITARKVTCHSSSTFLPKFSYCCCYFTVSYLRLIRIAHTRDCMPILQWLSAMFINIFENLFGNKLSDNW